MSNNKTLIIASPASKLIATRKPILASDRRKASFKLGIIRPGGLAVHISKDALQIT